MSIPVFLRNAPQRPGWCACLILLPLLTSVHGFIQEYRSRWAWKATTIKIQSRSFGRGKKSCAKVFTSPSMGETYNNRLCASNFRDDEGEGRGDFNSNGIEYEYIIPNPDAKPDFRTDLPSIFPPEVPAGMRGEAVRAALRSGRCVCWCLSSDKLGGLPLRSQGCLSVRGPGTMDFINNKFSQTFVAPPTDSTDSSHTGFVRAGCLLNPKGKLIDVVNVVTLSNEEVCVLTSPGHSSSDLFNRMDPLVFPMDQVKLSDRKKAVVLTFASSQLKHVKECFQRFVLPELRRLGGALLPTWDFPNVGEVKRYTLQQQDMQLLVLPTAVLPKVAAVGYTLVFDSFVDDGIDNDGSLSLPKVLVESLVSDRTPEGPIEIGALEYETLRIESGLPAFGHEYSLPKEKEAEEDEGEGEGGMDEKENSASSVSTKKQLVPAAPLELHFGDAFVDMNKGCYLGQEGVASMFKNPKGPPRLLYSVVFEDDFNLYDYQTAGGKMTSPDRQNNPTRQARVGDELFVLGSNEAISVGTLTSVAEPGGTGESNVMALTLVRRAESILQRMEAMGISLSQPFDLIRNEEGMQGNDKRFKKKPLDPLDGLEVIIGGTSTFGRLQSVAYRQGLPVGLNMFDDFETYEGMLGGNNDRLMELNLASASASYLEEEAAQVRARQGIPLTEQPASSTPPQEDDNDETEDGTDVEELQRQIAEAEDEARAAEAEAKRKAEKMEMLRKRAEEAMAKRKKKKDQS